MLNNSRDFLIYFHASLLRSGDKTRLHRVARLAHYFRFHYRCRTFLWNPQNEQLQRWHPQVTQEIPYPQISTVKEIQGDGPHIVFAAESESDVVPQWLKQYPETAVFLIEAGTYDFRLQVEKIEQSLDSVISPFGIDLAPGELFYDLYLDQGAWEEVFLKRTEIPPLDDANFRKFGPFVALRELEYAWSLGQLDRRPGAKTLDVGSYKTWVPRYLAESGFNVIALDIDPEAIEYQKKQAAQLAKPFEVLHADSTKIPLPDRSIDQILAISTVEHFDGEGDRIAMQEFHRLLHPGGLVILTMPYDHYWCHLDTGLRPGAGLQRFYTMEAAVSRLVQPPLFEIIAIEFIGGKMIEIGKFIPDYRNPTNAHLICLCLRKPNPEALRRNV